MLTPGLRIGMGVRRVQVMSMDNRHKEKYKIKRWVNPPTNLLNIRLIILFYTILRFNDIMNF